MTTKIKRRIEKQLVRLAGEDYTAYEKCSAKTKSLIRAIGSIVLFIFILTLVSITEAFTEFFHSPWVGLGIGIFVAWLVSNMYLLLLYTLTKNVLVPPISLISSRISFYIRLSTMAFLGMIVSKPIEHYLFKSAVQAEIYILKQDKIQFMEKAINESYSHGYTDLSPEEWDAQRVKDVEEARASILNNAYYIRTVQAINSLDGIWFFTGLVVLLFCFPTILKRRIGEESHYYKLRLRNQTSLIGKEYQLFLEKYQKAISQFTDEELAFQMRYEDPPYNQKRIQLVTPILGNEDFIKRIHE